MQEFQLLVKILKIKLINLKVLVVNREQFKIMMEFLREGDVLYITKLDRLARSVIDLHNTAKFLQNKDVNLKVLHQNIDTTSPAASGVVT
jgi:DNA invertase Pin-like site-specific DNA recombinase